MIVQVQGTSGAGKSTLARLLRDYTVAAGGAYEKILDMKTQKVLGYELRIPKRRRTICLVGKYETPCGGCDQVGSSKEVLRRVERWGKDSDVLFEGLLLSGGQGSLGRAMKRYGSMFAYAFLDTPLKTCLARVQKRRNVRAKAKGKKAEPLNPKNTTSKWNACQRYQEKARALGYRVVVLNHKAPLPGLLELFKLQPIEGYE